GGQFSLERDALGGRPPLHLRPRLRRAARPAAQATRSGGLPPALWEGARRARDRLLARAGEPDGPQRIAHPAGDGGGRSAQLELGAEARQRYFKPVPVLKTTTVSEDFSHPLA